MKTDFKNVISHHVGCNVSASPCGNIARKRFGLYAAEVHGRIMREVLFMQRFGPLGIAPKLIDYGYDFVDMEMIKGTMATEALRGLAAAGGDVVSFQRRIVETLFKIHINGYSHCDYHAGNLIVTGDGSVVVIDGEYSREMPDDIACAHGFDFGARGDWMAERFGHPQSAAALIDGVHGGTLRMLAAMLVEELRAASGSSSDVNDTRYIYHTYDLPGLRIEQPAAQRDVGARLDKYGINFAGRTVLDLGCNIGGLTLGAAARGATCVGVDTDAKRITVANRLARFGGLAARFMVGDIHGPLDAYDTDIVFLNAVDAYSDQPNALYEHAASKAKAVLIFETNRKVDHSDAQWCAYWKNLGFAKVTPLGVSDDDVRKANHWRKQFKCER